ncbi:MAG TPA: hypothetical protein VGL11_25655 [Candidatus Binatia bacterium]|jgi:hypothetical protein
MQVLDFAHKPAAELFYSHILRCIGQTLEQLELKAFEIKCQDDIYLVQGWQKAPSSAIDLKRRYTLDDLRELELELRRQRRPGSARPNPLKLSQFLRMAGNYVDYVGARLLRVEWQWQSDKVQCITIQYEGRDTAQEENGSSLGTIDEICIHIYKERKKVRTIPRALPSEQVN